MSEARSTYISINLKDEATRELRRIDSLVDDVTRNFLTFGDDVDDSTTGFSSLSKQVANVNRGLNQSTTASNSLQQEIQGVNQQAINANNSFGGMATTVGGIAVALNAITLGGGIVSSALEMEDAFARLEVRTGATAEELAEYEAIAKDVFVSGFTESIGEASDSVSTFGAMFKNLEWGELSNVVEGAHTISKAWDQDAKQVGKTVATMTKTFDGLSETEALDLITVGFKRTGDYSEDLLDTFNEYSTQFKALGYDAEGFTATLIAGAESGAFNFDKLADTAKEGFLKLGEGSKETTAALTAMGLDADQVINGIGQGGDEAQKAFMAVSSALAAVEDPAKRNQLAIASFGTPLEDLGPQFATFFSSVNQDLGNFEGATKDAADAMQNTFGNRMKTAWRDLGVSAVEAFQTDEMQTFLSTIANDVESALPSIKNGFSSLGEAISNNIMPAYENFKTGLNWLIDNKDTIISVGTGLAAGFAVFKGAEMAKGIFDVVKGFSLVGALSNPIGIAAVAIGGLVTAGVYLYQNWDTIKGKAEELWAKLRENPMMALVVGPIGAVIAAGIYLYNNWDTIKAKAGELWTVATEKFAGIKQAVSDFVSPAIGWFDNLSGKWNDFKSAISNFKVPEWMSTIGGAISSGISKVKSWAGADGSHATGLANVGWDGYRAELHKGESVLTAAQSNTLRGMGVLSANGDGTPNIDLSPLSAPVTPNVSYTPSTPAVSVTTNTKSNLGGSSAPIHVVNNFTINASGNDAGSIVETIKSVVPNLIRNTISDILDEELQTQ